MRFLLVLTLLFGASVTLLAAGSERKPAAFLTVSDSLGVGDSVLVLVALPDLQAADSLGPVRENKKVVAVILAVALGPFGGHRIYLNTSHRIPLAYVLTLGGGFGVLPLIDIIAMLATKNLDRYENNSRFFMWAD